MRVLPFKKPARSVVATTKSQRSTLDQVMSDLLVLILNRPTAFAVIAYWARCFAQETRGQQAQS